MDEKTLLKGLKDPRWRLANLYWVVNKSGQRVLFEPNKAQQAFLAGATNSDIILKARQLGYSTLACLIALDECVFYNDQSALIVAHTRDDAEKLFASKILYAWNNLPEAIRATRGVTHQTQSLLRWKHGSSIQVSNSGRSGSFTRVHISEFGKLCARFPDRAREVVTGTLPAAGKNPVTIESTAEGQEGYFYEFYSKAARNEGRFKLHFSPWWVDPDYVLSPDLVTFTEQHRLYFNRLKHEHGIELTLQQKAWWVDQEMVLGGDMKRENPSFAEEAFEQAIEGSYFAAQTAHADTTGAFGRFPYDSRFVVNTFWDLGRNDYNVIWLHQFVDKRHRMIGYYENSGEHISHYAQWLEQWRKDHNEARWGDHYWPHDGRREDLFLEQGRLGEAEKHGLRPQIVERPAVKMDAIDAARAIFPSTDFDKEACAQGIKRLRHYRKEWDDSREVWKDRPRHDDNSHAADAFMTFACGWTGASDTQINTYKRKQRQKRPSSWVA